MTQTIKNLQIRWMTRDDLPRVVAIEEASFPTGVRWSESDFLEFARRRDSILMVAETPDDRGFLHIAGFIGYQLKRQSLLVHNIAVGPLFRRLGVGRAMLDRLHFKLHQQRRNYAELLVREHNLDAQLWLRACGFVAVQIEHEYHEHPDGGPEDAIWFRRGAEAAEPIAPPPLPVVPLEPNPVSNIDLSKLDCTAIEEDWGLDYDEEELGR